MRLDNNDKKDLLWCGFCMLMGFIYVFMFWWGQERGDWMDKHNYTGPKGRQQKREELFFYIMALLGILIICSTVLVVLACEL